ncbi:MAG: hypothetical protein IJ626_02120 [Muribaculaceae bacterium]|nr:hypothetical protein [Muribaculaceae bacterium]
MKRFLIKIAYTVLPLWILFVGAYIYFIGYIEPNATGDLAVIGHLPLDKAHVYYPDQHNPLPILYEEIYDTAQIHDKFHQVLVIGDSFSQRGNGSFHNFLARDGFTVANVTPSNLNFWNPIQCAYELMKRGIADSTCCRTLIIQTGERYLISRLNQFSPDRQAATTKIKSRPAPTDTVKEEYHVKNPLIKTRDLIFCRLGINDPVKKVRLTRPLFTCDEPDLLLFFDEDITYEQSITETEGVRSKVNTIRAMARERGVNLVFLLAPDKYDLYQDFIVDNPYPRKTVNEDFRKIVGDDPHFIIGKELLLPLVKAGTKDVFIMDDTHWSCTTAERVAEHIKPLL